MFSLLFGLAVPALANEPIDWQPFTIEGLHDKSLEGDDPIFYQNDLDNGADLRLASSLSQGRKTTRQAGRR